MHRREDASAALHGRREDPRTLRKLWGAPPEPELALNKPFQSPEEHTRRPLSLCLAHRGASEGWIHKVPRQTLRAPKGPLISSLSKPWPLGLARTAPAEGNRPGQGCADHPQLPPYIQQRSVFCASDFGDSGLMGSGAGLVCRPKPQSPETPDRRWTLKPCANKDQDHRRTLYSTSKPQASPKL